MDDEECPCCSGNMKDCGLEDNILLECEDCGYITLNGEEVT
jgi:uncharacterized Zn finger protein